MPSFYNFSHHMLIFQDSGQGSPSWKFFPKAQGGPGFLLLHTHGTEGMLLVPHAPYSGGLGGQYLFHPPIFSERHSPRKKPWTPDSPSPPVWSFWGILDSQPHCPGVQKPNPALQLPSSVALSQFLNLSGPQFVYL